MWPRSPCLYHWCHFEPLISLYRAYTHYLRIASSESQFSGRAKTTFALPHDLCFASLQAPDKPGMILTLAASNFHLHNCLTASVFVIISLELCLCIQVHGAHPGSAALKLDLRVLSRWLLRKLPFRILTRADSQLLTLSKRASNPLC